MGEAGVGAVTVPFHGGALRPWRKTDGHKLVQAWTDAEIARWNGVPSEPTIATAERWIAGWQTRFDRALAVDLVIVERPITRDSLDVADEAVVGEVGLSSITQIPGGGRGALVGYWLLAHARGAGLAGRAVEACCTWARAELGLTVIGARCHSDNVASQAVVAQAGFVHERDDQSGHQLWFSRTRDD